MIDTAIRSGLTGSERLKAEEERVPSLVVMGSQGRGLIKKIFLGSAHHGSPGRGPPAAGSDGQIMKGSQGCG